MASRDAPLVLLVACTLTAGVTACYRPVIGDGTLACVDEICPRGFRCDKATLVCWRMSDAAVDQVDHGDQADHGDGGRGEPDRTTTDAASDVADGDAGPCGVAIPSGFGQACGACGGKVQCDGSCSVQTPAALGQSCGSCGGKVLCDGSCSMVTPAGYGTGCGGCGGRIRCDGSCDIPTPTNFGLACGSCGGTIQCNGTCGIADPPGLNTPCGSCGGKIQCGGQCSVATPADFGAIDTQPIMDSFACCFIDETRSYGPAGRNTTGCFAGYSYGGCSVAKQSGGGAVSVVTEDPATCTCRVHINNIGLEGATYVVSIRQIRGC